MPTVIAAATSIIRGTPEPAGTIAGAARSFGVTVASAETALFNVAPVAGVIGGAPESALVRGPPETAPIGTLVAIVTAAVVAPTARIVGGAPVATGLVAEVRAPAGFGTVAVAAESTAVR
ncbi:hypothetical protein [Nocardia cyriacigeorgica]|uniref:hypothetical protein n=1 Tax=Nocardia cyriacigeorgica TaxID=135487 RepID=UPI002454C81D|nr:hypothetical protein [Nocardia cyriacigeorgica]BDU06104.1 hypothetical protein FMUBM48_23670 [Nocardia cyriacigeorgica]